MAFAAAVIAIVVVLSAQREAGFSGSTSTSYSMNANKMAIDDQAFVVYEGLDQPTIEARNQKLQSDMAPSVHRYNMFWSSFESSNTPSSDSPLSCDGGYYMVPADSSGLKANGGKYNRYRCISGGREALAQQLLQADAAAGWESAAIVWCAPVYARDPGCMGQPEVATESALDNYTDTYAAPSHSPPSQLQSPTNCQFWLSRLRWWRTALQATLLQSQHWIAQGAAVFPQMPSCQTSRTSLHTWATE